MAKWTAKIRAELRWLSSAVHLIGRPDRTDALLKRSAELPDRSEVVQSAYAALLALDEKIDDSVEADITQFYDLHDELVQAAHKVQRGPLTAETRSPPPLALLGRLPTLDLPHFDGDLKHWTAYHDLFSSLVDARTDLAPSQKLAYLFSTLNGEALELVSHLAVTDQNYPTAQELLEKRYANIRRLADTHVAQILALPHIYGVATLRRDLVNPVMVALNALRRLGLPVDEWSFMLLHIVLSRLPTDLKLRFEYKHGGDSATQLPRFADLVSFLEEECRLVDNAGIEGPSGPSAGPPREQRRVAARPPKPGVVEPRRPPLRYATAHAPPRCVYCTDDGHLVAACPRFLHKRVKDRRGIANDRRWCYSCLGQHLQRDCPRPEPCSQCQGKHHLVLCANQNGGNRLDGAGRSPTGGGPLPHYPQRESRRGSPSTGGGTPPPSPRPQPRFAAAQRSSPPPSFSPPLCERPRLERRPPQFGRRPAYYASTWVRPGRRPEVPVDQYLVRSNWAVPAQQHGAYEGCWRPDEGRPQ